MQFGGLANAYQYGQGNKANGAKAAAGGLTGMINPISAFVSVGGKILEGLFGGIDTSEEEIPDPPTNWDKQYQPPPGMQPIQQLQQHQPYQQPQIDMSRYIRPMPMGFRQSGY